MVVVLAVPVARVAPVGLVVVELLPPLVVALRVLVLDLVPVVVVVEGELHLDVGLIGAAKPISRVAEVMRASSSVSCEG
jgi:hypothetical protein